MTTKLSPAQQRVIDAMAKGAEIVRVRPGMAHHLINDDGSDAGPVRNETFDFLFSRQLIRKAADSRTGSKPYYVLTDSGAALATKATVSDLAAEGESVASERPYLLYDVYWGDWMYVTNEKERIVGVRLTRREVTNILYQADDPSDLLVFVTQGQAGDQLGISGDEWLESQAPTSISDLAYDPTGDALVSDPLPVEANDDRAGHFVECPVCHGDCVVEHMIVGGPYAGIYELDCPECGGDGVVASDEP